MSPRVSLSFNDNLARRLPLPLAQLYRRAHNAKSALERHQAAYYLWEAALKLLASVAIVEYSRLDFVDADLSRRLESLARPSIGHWWEFVRRLVPILAETGGGDFGSPGDPDFRAVRDLILGGTRANLPRAAGLNGALAAALEAGGGARSAVRLSELFDRLVQYRNRELGHGAAGQRSASFYDEMGRALLAGVAELLEELDPLAGRRLVHVADVRRQSDGSWLVERYALEGETARRLETTEVPAEEAATLPRPGCVYTQRGETPLLSPLHPLVLWDPESGDFSFLNARRGERDCEYLCYSSGRVTRRDDLGAAHRELLATILRVPVDSEEAQRWTERTIAEEPAAPADAAPVGRRLGEFELLSRIGRGGMGVVYRAWQPSLGRQVALKCLFSAGDPKVESRFAREILALGRVEHPGLVKIFTSGSEGEQWFYAMELVEGADLARVCDQLAGSRASDVESSDWQRAVSSAHEKARLGEEPIRASGDRHSGGDRRSRGDGQDAGPSDAAGDDPATSQGPPRGAAPPAAAPGPGARTGTAYIRQAVEVTRQVAGAAHALHEAGVIHRDIKPGNIILTAEGSRAVLMDLGLAQLADDAQGRLTRTRQFVGTLRYASPEQVLAAGTLDPRSDVYSLGATLWELLTLRSLFGAGEETPTPELDDEDPGREPGPPTQAQPAHRHRPRGHRHEVPREAAGAALPLGRAAGRRPRTLAARRARERPAADGQLPPVEVRAPLPWAAHGGGGGGARARHARSRRDGARPPCPPPGAARPLRPLHQRRPRGHAQARHGRGPPLVRRGRARAARRPRARSGGENAPLELARRDAAAGPRPAARVVAHPIAPLRPRGLFLLVLADGGRAALWDLRAGSRMPLPGPEREVRTAAWSPRGDWLVLGDSGGASIFGFPGGQEIRRLEGTVDSLAFSPDGRLLALGGEGVRLFDCDKRALLERPIKHPAPVRFLSFSRRGDRLLTAAEDNLARLFEVSPDGKVRLLLEPLRHLVTYNIAGLSRLNVPWDPVLVNDGRELITVTTPTEATWWDVATGSKLRVIPANDRLASVTVSPDGSELAVVDLTQWQLWSVARRQPIGPAIAPTGALPLAVWSLDGAAFLVASGDDHVREWTIPPRTSQRVWSSNHPRVSAMAPLQRPLVALTVSPGGEVRRWRSKMDWCGSGILARRFHEAPPDYHPPSSWPSGAPTDSILLLATGQPIAA